MSSNKCAFEKEEIFTRQKHLLSHTCFSYYSHWGHLAQTPSIPGIQGEKFPCTRGLLRESVLHRFGINRPVLSCLFLFSLKRTSVPPVLRLLPFPPPPSDDSCFHPKASSRSFSPPGSLLPITYPCLGRLGVRVPSENLLRRSQHPFLLSNVLGAENFEEEEKGNPPNL